MATSQPRVLGTVDLAHPTRSQPRADTIGSGHGTGHETGHGTGSQAQLGRAAGQHFVRDLFNRLAQECAIVSVLIEQGFHLTAKSLIAAADALQEGLPRSRFTIQRGVEDVFDLPPLFGWHGLARPLYHALAHH
jgi:hypothetical protein